MRYCAVLGCRTTEKDEKKLFSAPADESRRALWIYATGKNLSLNTKFVVCEDHFDMEKDVAYFNKNGVPFLEKDVISHIGLGESSQGRSAAGITASSANLFAYDQSSQTDNTVRGISVGCQTDFLDVAFFRNDDIVNSDATLANQLETNEPISNEPSSDSFELLESSSTSKEHTSSEGYIPDDDEETEEETDSGDDVEDDLSGIFDEKIEEDEQRSKEQESMSELTMSLMMKQLQHYTGISPEPSYILDVLINKTGISKRNLLLVLRKIRHDESFQILGDSFGVSRVRVGRIFCTEVKKLAEVLKPFIYWPEPTYIKYNLPLQFKDKFRNVQIIIDCFEISIRKPKKIIDQALSWSSYKHSNTVKFLIGATPDGLIIFISKGFSGRITDTEIIKRSGFLDFIKQNTEVMADRGFKDVAGDVMSKGGILIKPPSTKARTIYTAEKAKMCKDVAAVRIHIERVIGRIRNFAFLKPQRSMLNSKRVYLLEYAVVVASAFCNMSGLLTKI